MCTVTYLPKNNGFLLTSSRDEKVFRKAETPANALVGDRMVFFPRDPKAGGTWIACSEERIVCLLNGAFQKHVSTPPYRKSRGLVVLDYFRFQGIEEFSVRYSFDQIEPFTLVVIEELKLWEFRWDGRNGTLTSLDSSQPRIWSSCTLYSPPVIEKRERWFSEWLTRNSSYSTTAIRSFHKTGGEGDPENDFNMHREDGLQTISISSIEKNDMQYCFTHEDMVSETEEFQNKVTIYFFDPKSNIPQKRL